MEKTSVSIGNLHVYTELVELPFYNLNDTRWGFFTVKTLTRH